MSTKSKNKKALLDELSQESSATVTKRSRGPMNLGDGNLTRDMDKPAIDETNEPSETVIDFSYKVDHDKSEVYFYDKSEGENTELVWDFGNGETFEGNTPGKISYDVPGKYQVVLKDNLSGQSKEKSFSIKASGSDSPEEKEALRAEKIKLAYTGGFETFIEKARREEFDFGVNNVRLSKNIHSTLSRICVNRVSITSLTNYILAKFIEDNREEVKKYLEENSKLEF